MGDEIIDSIIFRLVDEKAPILVINGLSGVGKTSLVRAGLVPRLRREHILVAYTRILDTPYSDVLRDISATFPAVIADQAQDLLGVVTSITTGTNTAFVLIIDQLERCFNTSTTENERLLFWREIGPLVGGESLGALQLVLVTRADWLYALQEVREQYIDIPIFSFLYPVGPMNVREAKAALKGPLDLLEIGYDDGLIELMVDDLAGDAGVVNPPELQIVGQALYRSAQAKRGITVDKISTTDYKDLEGARTIIRNHLSATVASLGPKADNCWKVLLRLVGPDKTRLTAHQQDLQSGLSEPEFGNVILNLTRSHLVVRDISSVDNMPVYSLTHDYLVEEIERYVSQDQQLLAWRTAEHYLSEALIDWRYAQKKTVATTSDPRPLLDKTRYQHIWRNRDALGQLDVDSSCLLARSGLFHFEPSFLYWYVQAPEESSEIVLGLIVRNSTERDIVRRKSIQKSFSIGLSEVKISESRSRSLVDAFWNEYESSKSVDESESWKLESLACTIWTLRSFCSTKQTINVAPYVAQQWLRNNAAKIAISVTSILLALVLVCLGVWIDQQLRGEWYQLEPLYAGPVRIAFGPGDSDVLYAVTANGPRPGEGATVLRHSANNSWSIRCQDLTNWQILDLVVTSPKNGERVYISVQARGIMRSDDQGSTWDLINNGLISFDIRQIAASTLEPNLMYAVSGDRKGIFRTNDGGDLWEDVSGEVLFGTSVLAVAFSEYNGGLWLVGTDAGVIATKSDDAIEWERRAVFPGTGSITTIQPEAKTGAVIYAGTSNGDLLKSENGGQGWNIVSRIPNMFSITSIAVVPDRPEILYVAAYGIGGYVVWYSDDGGNSWREIPNNNYTREAVELTINPKNPEELLVSGIPGLFRVKTLGGEWIFDHTIGSPLASVQQVVTSHGPDSILYISVGGAIYTTTSDDSEKINRGRNLEAISIRDMATDPNDPTTAYAGVYLPNRWSVYQTKDSGITWDRLDIPANVPEEYLSDTATIAVTDADGVTTVIAGTNGCGVWVTNDHGQTWHPSNRTDCQLPTNEPKYVYHMDISPQPDAVIYATADSHQVFVSRNLGRSWHSYELPSMGIITDIAADPVVKDRVYIASTTGLWQSDNAAKDWNEPDRHTAEVEVVAIASLPEQAENLIIATDTGEIWRTRNGGTNWRNITENLSVTTISSLDYDISRQELVVSTFNHGVYRYREGSLWADTPMEIFNAQ